MNAVLDEIKWWLREPWPATKWWFYHLVTSRLNGEHKAAKQYEQRTRYTLCAKCAAAHLREEHEGLIFKSFVPAKLPHRYTR